MEFKEQIELLSSKINQRKLHISDEANTKKSLIEPFISLLGFDIFEPSEVKLEFTADYGIKKGEKVDYAIFKNGSLIMFLEAKSVNEELSNNINQLTRYYNSTPSVKFAVLSNGIKYMFFTDLKNTNLMDIEPFFEFDITNLKDSDICSVEKFRKEKFDNKILYEMAKNLSYAAKLDKRLKELFIDPNENFITFLMEEIGEKDINSKLIEQFKPLVKKSVFNTILEFAPKNFEVRKVIEKYAPVEIKKEDTKTTFKNENEIMDLKSNNSEIFYCKVMGNKIASGRLLLDHKFLVLKDSKAVLEEKSSFGISDKRRRTQLLTSGILKEEYGYLIFVEDYTFDSPSSAARAILARSSNGWTEWVNSKNETLNIVYRN